MRGPPGVQSHFSLWILHSAFCKIPLPLLSWDEFAAAFEQLCITEHNNSGAPARAKRAWDRALYSWNMVYLFSFGCHVIDRAYVRTYVRVYRLYGWGRGDYQKEGRGVSGVSLQVLIFYIGHCQYGQLTAVKTG